MNEFVYCAVDKNNNIQWVTGSSTKTRYFKTPTYLKKAVKYHNEHYPNDNWRVVGFLLDMKNGVILDV